VNDAASALRHVLDGVLRTEECPPAVHVHDALPILILEFLANNVFNHPNYMDPNTNITSAGLTAVITAVQDRNSKMDTAIPRVLQAQLRVEW
jgi:hypothetical protein